MRSGFGFAETTPHWVLPVGVCGKQVPSHSPFWWGLCFLRLRRKKHKPHAPTLLRSYAPTLRPFTLNAYAMPVCKLPRVTIPLKSTPRLTSVCAMDGRTNTLNACHLWEREGTRFPHAPLSRGVSVFCRLCRKKVAPRNIVDGMFPWGVCVFRLRRKTHTPHQNGVARGLVSHMRQPKSY